MKYLLFIFLSTAMLTGCFKTRSDIAEEKEAQEFHSNLQENIANQGEALDRVQSQVGQLQGRLEELEHERSKEYSQGQSGKKDIEQRLATMLDRLSEMEKQQNILFEEVKKLREDGPKEIHAKKSAVLEKKNPQAAYEAGVKLLKARKYADAAEKFNIYIKENPRGKNSLEAHYYAGEALFHEKDYAASILAFSVVQEKSAKSSMGKAAMLRMAESFSALGKTKEARTFAQLLIDTHPQTPEALKAKRFLK